MGWRRVCAAGVLRVPVGVCGVTMISAVNVKLNAPGGGGPPYMWSGSTIVQLRAPSTPAYAPALSCTHALSCRGRVPHDWNVNSIQRSNGANEGRDGDDDSSLPSLLALEMSLRSTFQRSRGIIVKRLAPFSLERGESAFPTPSLPHWLSLPLCLLLTLLLT